MHELFRYAAFISYSSKDTDFARRLHRSLEKYSIPRSLGSFDIIGGGKANRIYPVFRDREELSAGDLGPGIEAALRASSALIVVCSPDSANSPWVAKEIEHFISLGRIHRIFAIIPDTITSDEAELTTSECFPESLRRDGSEKIAADARKRRDGFRPALLKLIAGLIDVNAGALEDRDRKRTGLQRLRVAFASAMGFGAVLTGTALALASQYQAQSESLTELARAANDEGLYDRAARYAVRGMYGDDHAAAAELIRALVADRTEMVLRGHTGSVEAAQFSPDGSLVLTTSRAEQRVRIWSAAGDELTSRRLSVPDVVGARFSADARQISTLRIINDPRQGERFLRETWDERGRLQAREELGHSPSSTGQEFAEDGLGSWWIISPDKRTLVRKQAEGKLSITNAATHRVLISDAYPEGETSSVIYSPSGRLLCLSGTGGVSVRDARTGGLLFRPSSDYGNCGKFDARDRLMMVYGNDGYSVWDVPTRRVVASWREYPGTVRTANAALHMLMNHDFSAAGDRVVVADQSREVRVFRVDNNAPALVEQPRSTSMALQLVLITASGGGPTPAVVSVGADGTQLLAQLSPMDGSPKALLIDRRSGDVIGEIPNGRVRIASARFSSRGDQIIISGRDGILSVWELEAGRPSTSWRLHSQIDVGGMVGMADLTPDGRHLATIADNAIRLWDVAAERELVRFALPAGAENSLTQLRLDDHARNITLWRYDGPALHAAIPETIDLRGEALRQLACENLRRHRTSTFSADELAAAPYVRTSDACNTADAWLRRLVGWMRRPLRIDRRLDTRVLLTGTEYSSFAVDLLRMRQP